MNNTKVLVMAQCERLIQLINELEDADFKTQQEEEKNKGKEYYYSIDYARPIRAEIKAKMHELRRDTVRLEKEL